MGILDKITRFYESKYKILLLIPVIMLVFSIFVISSNYVVHGDVIQKGISLKGGTTLTLNRANIDINSLSLELNEKFGQQQTAVRSLTSVGEKIGVIIDASSDINSSELLVFLKQKYGDNLSYAVENIGSALGESFFKESIKSVIFAFLFMAIIVLLYFRAFVPAFYVVSSAAFDMLFAVALADLFNIKISTAGIAAFLMLIGYSVDTDILLTARVLKSKEGTVFERIKGSVKTGLTMTFAALVATLIAFFFTPSEVLKQIMLILFFGLLADIPSTWFMNAGLLRLYLEKDIKEKPKQHQIDQQINEVSFAKTKKKFKHKKRKRKR